jgi:hypothetical protein
MNAQKFSAKAHTRTDYNYSIFHQSLLHENNGEDYALRHIYSLENTKAILKKQFGWTDEEIKKGIDHATIDVYAKVVYLHIPNKIDKRGEKIKIKGISRFISKINYVNTLIDRCWTKADPYKLEMAGNWDEFISKGNTGDFYELKMTQYEITCTCHAFRGTKKAFEQDQKAADILINHPIAQGQIPDKHIFAVWKYLGADNQREYEYCWMERKNKATKSQWEFDPVEDYWAS